MSYYEPQTAKKVYLYRNGTVNADAKLLVVNDRQVRDFSSFLNRVTSGIRAPVAVRNIYTPHHGHKVRSLEELVSGKYYVAGGSEQFKRVKYGSGPKLLPRRQQRVEVVSTSVPLPHMIVAESRYRRPVEKPFVIHVFRNGDELFHGVRVLLHRRVMACWDHVLEIVTEKAELCRPAKKLCTLDGEVVTQLQDGGKYVAVEGGKQFRRVAYCATNTTAAVRRRRNAALKLPVLTRRMPKPRGHPSLLPPPAQLSSTVPLTRPQPPPVDPTATLLVPPQRKLRPMAGRKNKEARERALLENRDDSVFGGSPVMQTRPAMPSPPPSASTANLLTTHTLSASPGEDRGHGHIGIHGNGNIMGPDPLMLGENEKGGVAKLGGAFELEPRTIQAQPEITILNQDGNSTHFAQLPTIVTEENPGCNGPGDNTAAAARDTKTPAEEVDPVTEGAPLEQGQDETSNNGVSEIFNKGAHEETPPGEEAQISSPPEARQNEGVQISSPPEARQNEGVQSNVATEGGQNEGFQNSLPTEAVPAEVPLRDEAQIAADTSELTSNSNERVTNRTSSEVGHAQEKGESDREREREDEDDANGSSDKITDSLCETEKEGERETTPPIVTHNDQSSPKAGAREPEPAEEEVPEEVGVAERSEVKEVEEPKMKVLQDDVELVAEPVQTSVDLTMSRNTQQQLSSMTPDYRGNETPPTQTEAPPTVDANGEGVRGENSDNGEASASLPQSTDTEQVLVVEDPPQ